MATATRRSGTESTGLMRWGIVVAATLVLAVAMGGRFLIGIVFDEVRGTFAISTGTLGLVVSLAILVQGVAQPGIGWLVDRLTARVVGSAGLGLLGIGLAITGRATSMWELLVGYSLLVALGLAAVSPVTVTPLVAGWFVKRRATALSIVNAGGSIGQLAIVPGLTAMVGLIGWRDAYVVLAAGLVALGAPLILWLLREREFAQGVTDAAIGCSLRTAVGARSFWQLTVGFFVCGFTMAWVMTYFVDYAVGQGMSKNLAAAGLSLMGGLSIIGSLGMGWWADRKGGSLPLAVVYALRGIGFAVILLARGSFPAMLLAMAIVGASWSATVPLTSAICANIYGRRSLGAIFGLMFAIMPIGSAAGSALAGGLYDLTGSYTISLVLNVAAGLIASAAVVSVRSTPLFERGRAPEPAPLLAD